MDSEETFWDATLGKLDKVKSARSKSRDSTPTGRRGSTRDSTPTGLRLNQVKAMGQSLTTQDVLGPAPMEVTPQTTKRRRGADNDATNTTPTPEQPAKKKKSVTNLDLHTTLMDLTNKIDGVYEVLGSMERSLLNLTTEVSNNKISISVIKNDQIQMDSEINKTTNLAQEATKKSNNALSVAKTAHSVAEKVKEKLTGITAELKAKLDKSIFNEFNNKNKESISRVIDLVEDTPTNEQIDNKVRELVDNALQTGLQVQIKQAVANELGRMTPDLFQNNNNRQAEEGAKFPVEKTVVCPNFPTSAEENPDQLRADFQALINHDISIDGVKVVRAERYGNNRNGGVVKIQLASENQRNMVLQCKYRLRQSRNAVVSGLFLRASKSKEQLVMESNMKVLSDRLGLDLTLNDRGYLQEENREPRDGRDFRGSREPREQRHRQPGVQRRRWENDPEDQPRAGRASRPQYREKREDRRDARPYDRRDMRNSRDSSASSWGRSNSADNQVKPYGGQVRNGVYVPNGYFDDPGLRPTEHQSLEQPKPQRDHSRRRELQEELARLDRQQREDRAPPRPPASHFPRSAPGPDLHRSIYANRR